MSYMEQNYLLLTFEKVDRNDNGILDEDLLNNFAV